MRVGLHELRVIRRPRDSVLLGIAQDHSPRRNMGGKKSSPLPAVWAWPSQSLLLTEVPTGRPVWASDAVF